MTRITCLVFCFLIFSELSAQLKQVKYLTVPGYDQYSRIDTAGISVLPSGRFVTPAGKTIRITSDPFGLAISPDGKKLVSLHNGVFTIIDQSTLQHTRIPSYDGRLKSPLSNGSFLGVAFGADSKTIYLSGGDNGAVIIYDINSFERIDSVSLNGQSGDSVYAESFTSDLLVDHKNNQLLVLDRGNFRLVKIDLKSHKILESIPTGRQPFGLSLSTDGNFAVVANVGMYDYPLLPDLSKENYKDLLPWHPYGNNTKESIEGYNWNGRWIPGVGSPNHPDGMSVFVIDLKKNKVLHKIKTGRQIGHMVEDAEVVGGASPNSIAMSSKYAYVTNATNDNISVLDPNTGKIIKEIQIKVDSRIDKYRGLLPFGITISKDERTLYVALLGFNAIAVIDANSGKTKGLIPTGWGPSRVVLSKDQKEMYVISSRGYGAGPNGGANFIAPPQGTYIGDIQLATFQKINMPGEDHLKAYTKNVIENTFIESSSDSGIIPVLPGRSQSPIKHIVYITKENRTYDEVMGKLKSGKGDSTLARFGNRVNIFSKNDSLMNVNVMPNHLKLAVEFSFSDNFYCDSDASIHGHHWMMGVIPNEWVETNSSADATFNAFSKVPGRRFPRSTGSMDPEDYAEIGGLWEALERNNIPFYNFGQANETGSVREYWDDTLTGAAHGVMVPIQNALYRNTSRNYAGYNTNIPDQFRIEQFEKEFTDKWLSGNDSMPAFITIQLSNDHGAAPRPEDGYPYQHSYMADNDLALGRMISFLSTTLYWKNMLVIITEDDPQGGVDHLDAHRSILMMAGPYVKRNYTSHTHANFGSILKLIYNVLGINYVNQYDITASLLNDFFTEVPDYSPYRLVLPDAKVFDADKAMKKYDRTIDWRKIKQGPKMDHVPDMKNDHYETLDKN